MNITRENTDKLTALLKVKIGQEDYTERVDKVLNDYRKNAKMPGFRPGKVPAGIIRKLYRKPVVIEEINKILSESVTRYLTDEKIRIIGEPLPGNDNKKEINWDNDSEFEFEIEVGLAPEFEVSISDKDKIPLYEIEVDDELINETKENYSRRFGTMIKVESITGNEILKGDFHQIDLSGNVQENGIVTENATFSLEYVKEKNITDQFTGKKAGDHVVFDIRKAFPDDTDLGSLLNIKKEQIISLNPQFRFDIKEISKFIKAEYGQELYDLIYGKDVIHTEEEFNDRIKNELHGRLEQNSEFRFRLDVRDLLMKNTILDLPSAFLKKWLVIVNKEKANEQQIEEEFPKFETDLKWQLIKDKVIVSHELKVTEEEIAAYAKSYTLLQFRQYGIVDIPEDQLKTYSENVLKNEEERKKIVEKLFEEKVFEHIKEHIKVDKKKITRKKFNKLFDK
jgi:trigger factor